MRAEIARIQRDLRVTTIYVTHDQSEAMTLGDRVCVMRGGLLQQVDRPQVLYDRPANLFVAGFIGSPAMNLVEAELGGRLGALRPARARRSPSGARGAAAAPRPYAGRRVALGIRPEDIRAARRAARRSRSRSTSRRTWAPRCISTSPSTPRRSSRTTCARSSATEALEAAEEQTHHHGSPFIARVERGTRRARGGEDAAPRRHERACTSSISRPAPGSTPTRATAPAILPSPRSPEFPWDYGAPERRSQLGTISIPSTWIGE